MQLVAYGAQDVYLTGNPKVTFFQAVYKRHTNFAMENIEQVVNGSAGDSGRLSVTIARNGDLIGNMYMDLVTKASVNKCWAAERAVQDIELTIGGQRIDKHYQRWWRLYAELYLDEAKKANWGKMTSDVTAGTNRVFLPLIFFFNRNPGLYLPLIGLQYHEVRLDIDLSAEFSTYFSTSGVKVWGNYVYLDTDERRRFAQKGHEYLIEQVQHTGADSIGDTTSAKQVRLSYNHPVKELVWCFNNEKSSGADAQANELWNFTSNVTQSEVVLELPTDTASNIYVAPSQMGAPQALVGGPNSRRPIVEKAESTTAVTGGPLKTFKLLSLIHISEPTRP